MHKSERFLLQARQEIPELIPEKSFVYIATDAFSRRQYIGWMILIVDNKREQSLFLIFFHSSTCLINVLLIEHSRKK